MLSRAVRAVLGAMSTVSLLALVPPTHAQPSADQVLADVGLSADDKQRVMKGEFVTADLAGVSERSLAVSIVFLAKTSPDALSKQIVASDLIGADPLMRAHGAFSRAGSPADLSKVQVAGFGGSAKRVSVAASWRSS